MLVSVIMPTYNCGKYIKQSIDSVIAQSISDWELIIVDDCSSDDTKEIVAPYLAAYPNIHFVMLDCNSGAAAARNVAMNRAKGKYIAFLDSDDLWRPEKLEKQISFMQNNGVPFSCTAYSCMDEDGNLLNVSFCPPYRTSYKTCLRLSNPIGNLTAMFNREVLGDFVVPLIRKRNDFALWLQVLKKTDYCYGMTDDLAVYRMGRDGGISKNKFDLIKYQWKLYHEIEGITYLKCLFYMLCWVSVKLHGRGKNAF